MKRIYLDNAATTKVHPSVISSMQPYFSKNYGNPSEYHLFGRLAKKAIENSRKEIAIFLGCLPKEIFFTSSATESINLSHKGFIEAITGKFQKTKVKPHIITTKVEHKAVLETCRHMQESGLTDTTYLDVNKYGRINPKELLKAIKKNTALVSIMYVNNEVGTVQPIPQVGRLLGKLNKSRKNKIVFHTDATQAVGYLDTKVKSLGTDFLSLTGHKISAPKGVGVLYVKQGTPIVRQIDGGTQETELRSGTENVPYIVALGAAIKLIGHYNLIVQKNRDYLIKKMLEIPGVKLTGHPKLRAPHIASFIVEGVEGEALVLKLSEKGICASSGSACTSLDLSPSHVLLAMGLKPEESHGSIRFSLSQETTREEINYLISVIPKIINDLRQMSPLN